NPVQAIEALEKGATIAPGSADRWTDLGQAGMWATLGEDFVDLGSFQAALAPLNKTIEIEPDHAAAWFYKGIAHINLGQIAEAAEAYHKAVYLEPENGVAWFGYGSAQVQMAHYDCALDALS